jgi:YD repeat-containing protein
MQQRQVYAGRVWALATLLWCACPSVLAQATFTTFEPPGVDVVDAAGVSLISGHAQFPVAPVSIGPKGAPLVFKGIYEQYVSSSPQLGMYGSVNGGNNFSAYLEPGYVEVHVFEKAEVFVGDRVSSYQSYSQSGGILTVSNGNVTKYTDSGGVQYNFRPVNNLSTCTNNVTSPGITYVYTYSPLCAVLTSVVYPDGTTLTLTLVNANPTGFYPGDFQNRAFVRSDGFALHVDYQNVQSGSQTDSIPTAIKAANLAVDYCDMTQVTLNCTFSQTWPTASYSWSPSILLFTVGSTQTVTVTDQRGAVTQFTQQMYPSVPTGNMYPAVNAVKAATSASANTATYQTSAGYICTDGGGYWNCQATRQGLVTNATTGNGSWAYTFSNPGYPNDPVQDLSSQNWFSQSTRSDNAVSTAEYNSRSSYINNVVTPTGTYFYANFGNPGSANPNRIQQAVDAEGRTFNFTYDSRGNTTAKRQVGSDGSNGPLWQANFDTTCVYPVKCNKPNWIIDPNGKETDYTYDPTHGGILTETLPADSNGVRPQKRYTYVQLYAWIKNSSSGYTQSAVPIWKLSSMSSCNSGTWNGTNCVNAQNQTIANDLVVTAYNYGPNSGPNNLLLRGQTVTAGGVNHVTCYGYDWLGNKISEATPNAGLTSCP